MVDANCEAPAVFDAADRAALLRWPQIGPTVIERLEAAGFYSLATIRDAGIDAVVAGVCRQAGNDGFRNRRRALERALGIAA